MDSRVEEDTVDDDFPGDVALDRLFIVGIPLDVIPGIPRLRGIRTLP
nr:hypothetical protein [Candidatus Sigynarchaeum springense]MDO8118564.1 hypothetical protein [Candidatus Sigynarchaeota archaeon]